MKRLILAAFAAMLTAAMPAAAQDAAARGLQIVREAERRDAGWRDAEVAMTMVLQDRKGATRERTLRMMMLEVPGERGGDKSIAIFDSPPDLKGTILLTHTRIGADDNQWLYLPGLKRVKRISSSNKTGAFFASEFAYEDIAAPEVGRYNYVYLGQKACGSLTCSTVEERPDYRNSGYSKLVAYIDTQAYRTQRIEYFDGRGKLLKVLDFGGYRQAGGRFWRPQVLTMSNRKTGRTTILRYGRWSLGTGLSDATFSQQNLRNIR